MGFQSSYRREILDDGLLELPIDIGSGHRVYFGQLKEQRIVILWAGDQGTQDRDIEKGQRYWTDCGSQDAE